MLTEENFLLRRSGGILSKFALAVLAAKAAAHHSKKYDKGEYPEASVEAISLAISYRGYIRERGHIIHSSKVPFDLYSNPVRASGNGLS